MLRLMLVPAAVYALMLLVPGYLLLRCVRFPRMYSLCCAPIISTALVGIVGELYAALKIPATPLTAYGLIATLPLLAFVILHVRHTRAAQAMENREGNRSGRRRRRMADLRDSVVPWWVVLAFSGVGILICNNLFASELPALDAIMQNYDNQHHLNVIRGFVDARRISSLGVNFFPAAADTAIRPFGHPSFYPAVWYGQCALLAMTLGLEVPVAINVSLAVTMGLAYPLGICAFASSTFGGRRGPVAFCALTCVGFATFPWCLLVFGPLYPNLVGFCLMPASMALCMHGFQFDLRPRELAQAWVLILLSLVGQGLLHPNTLFSMFLILIPFAAFQIYDLVRHRGGSLQKALVVVAGFLCACLVFWALCLRLPQLSGVTGKLWSRYAYPWQEVINIVTQTYTLFFFYEITAQVLLGALVVVGFVRAAYDRPVRWLTCSYLMACWVCFVNATSYSTTLKRFFAGFWYTDAMRVSVTAIVVAALLAAYGLDWVFCQARLALDAYNARLGRRTHPQVIVAVVSVCFLVFNFMPGFNWPGAHADSTNHIVEYRMEGHEYDSNSVKTTFGDYRQILRSAYSFTSPLDEHEMAFLADVREVVGNDLVINNPYDGSTLLYGTYGIRTYYRNYRGYGDEETEQSKIIRAQLRDIAANDAVRQAVDGIGARYVLLLDAGNSQGSYLRMGANLTNEDFDGIAKITPDTPGFTEVLTSGACRLYRID